MPASPAAAPTASPSPRAARLAGLLRVAAPASPPAPDLCTFEDDRPVVAEKATQVPASPPDHAALAIAARLILNSVSECVFKLASPPRPDAPSPAQPDPVASVVTLPELINHFFADDERRVMRVVARDGTGKGVTGTSVVNEIGMSESEFWVVWKSLQERGLILEVGSGKNRRYHLGCEWVRLLLS